MRYIAFQAQRLFTKTTRMRRFQGGPLLKDIIQHVNEKISKLNDRKLYLYSAHDMTLLAVMEALGVTYFYQPDHLDALIFELHQNTDNQFQIEVKSNTFRIFKKIFLLDLIPKSHGKHTRSIIKRPGPDRLVTLNKILQLTHKSYRIFNSCLQLYHINEARCARRLG